MAALRIRAHHAERPFGRKLLVPGARRQHDHVAGLRRHLNAGATAELHRHFAAVDAEHFVAIAVIVVERMHAVTPRRRPAVLRKNFLELLRHRIGHRAGIDQQRPARMVRDRPIRLEQMRDDVHSAAATAAPNAPVPSLPPRSAVRVSRFASTLSTAASIALPAWVNAAFLRRSPIHSRSMAAERISEVGLALSLPAISGAEPCCACAAHKLSPAFTEPARPRLPESSEARSERMSA